VVASNHKSLFAAAVYEPLRAGCLIKQGGAAPDMYNLFRSTPLIVVVT